MFYSASQLLPFLGSPLYCPVEGDENNFLQFGISSYVYKPGTPDEPFIDFELDCSQLYSAFVNVAPFIPWIKKNAEE